MPADHVRGLKAPGSCRPSRSGLQHRDGLDLDQEFGLRQRGDRDQRMRRHFPAEELLADRAVIGAVADVGQVGVDLDDSAIVPPPASTCAFRHCSAARACALKSPACAAPPSGV